MTTSLNPVAISPVEDIVADMRAGRMVILVDEEDRENEGDLILASDHVTPEAINFMARHARGLICLTLSREMCERLKLPPMVARNNAQHATAFTVSIEAAEGVTTGISAADRSRTVQAAVAPNAQAHDLVQPGHIFPLQANSLPTRSATNPATKCTWLWSKAHGMPTTPWPCGCTSPCRCWTRWKSTAPCIHGAWTPACAT